jgi:hypothetical protein
MPVPAPPQPVEGTISPDAILTAWEPEKTSYDVPKPSVHKTTVTSSTVTSSTVTSPPPSAAASSKPTESKPMLDSDDDDEDEEDDDLPAFDMSHDVKVVRGKDAPTFRYLRDVLDHLGEVGVVEYTVKAEFIDPVREL